MGKSVLPVEDSPSHCVFGSQKSYNSCAIPVLGSEYCDWGSGVEEHKKDIRGDEIRFGMTAEQKAELCESAPFIYEHSDEMLAETLFSYLLQSCRDAITIFVQD